MIAITTRSSMSVKPRRAWLARQRESLLDDTQHFLDRGEPCFDLRPAIRAEGAQPLLLRE
jgi:hypothetical protein